MRHPATFKTFVFVLCLCAAPCARVAAAQENASARVRVGGVVRDEAGAPVRGAEVTIDAGRASARRAETGDDGRFVFDGLEAKEGTLRVRAGGFASRELRWGAGEGGAAEVSVVLAPAPLGERVTVTAMRTDTAASETAASVTVVSAEALAATAALTLDDALRQVPGFQLFRRSGSRAANPTTQGVSLRGVGPSGASRALVLVDGVPLNDPFGGWVYWGRVPRESVDRVEVVRGGASHLYGSAAMGGVIQVLTRRAEDDGARLSLVASYGSQRTHDASLFAATRKRGWDFTLAAETFHTGGYFLVARDERGAADARASSRFGAASASVGRELTSDLRVFARGSYYGEARDNGTRLQYNRTRVRQLVAGGDWRGAGAGVFTLRLHALAQVFDQSFTALAADRDSETLTRVQRVPSQAAGLSVQWSRALGTRHALVAGLEAREVRGASDEIIFASGRASSLVGAGGRERTLGVYVEDLFHVTPRLLLSAGVRLDAWRNFDASEATRPVARPDLSAVTNFADRSETALSPRASLLYKLGGSSSLYASAYRAFRAPTLNELYRDFRVGNVLTLANEALRAERLTGGEAGLNVNTLGGRLNARAAFFWLELARPVANVTLAASPALITRQRQNLGRTRSRGVEAEAEARLSRRWSASAGYQFTGARVVRFPASVELEGRRVPQVPRQQLTFGVNYDDPARLSFGVQGRASGPQFDDDLNLFRLGRLFTLDALASRRVTESLSAFVAVENLTGRRYEVGRTPVVTLGPPLSARFGLRVRLGSR